MKIFYVIMGIAIMIAAVGFLFNLGIKWDNYASYNQAREIKLDMTTESVESVMGKPVNIQLFADKYDGETEVRAYYFCLINGDRKIMHVEYKDNLVIMITTK